MESVLKAFKVWDSDLQFAENLAKVRHSLDGEIYAEEGNTSVFVRGDGRDLSALKDNSIDCIITDHPWLDGLSNVGCNRNYAPYECFRYVEGDFQEKARVLRNGCFCCEIIPLENVNNFDYLYQIKKMAQRVGLEYYAKIPWIKGNFVSNTGRCSKNSEDILFLTKGQARCMRENSKGGWRRMSGTRRMLPTAFNVQMVPVNLRLNSSTKPYKLFEEIISYVTWEDETVLDQFAGSAAVGAACSLNGRNSISIEKDEKLTDYILDRLKLKDEK